MINNKLKDILFGVAVGDALGVPVEFKTREYLDKYPVSIMQEYGTHNQPKGTWSDDSSLTFCMVEAMKQGFELHQIATNFIKWFDNGWWTAHNEVFDVGAATRDAIHRLRSGVQPLVAGGDRENDNGNGSLMRIAPLLIYIYKMPINERFGITKEISSITHRHIRSVLACFYYLEFLRNILLGNSKEQAFIITAKEFTDYTRSLKIKNKEIGHFERLCSLSFLGIPRNEIKSSGYVIHTLEAAIWCFMNSESYSEIVLKAVNLGDDTDTTAAVAGGLAGLFYGYDNIPQEWINELARNEDINELALA
ncbi:MAG: ADP-ribosylglycohydrolase family protein [Paludibacter sp.]|nr:ADP-ribosylglycohydrolase family protein [Paludibacter sp.]